MTDQPTARPVSDIIRVRNWERWQSYRSDRGQPPWIKVHREVMRNPDWVTLTDVQRGHLVAIWLLAADRDGVIPASPDLIQKLCYMDEPPDLQVLADKGFIEPDDIVTSERRRYDAKVTPERPPKARSREAEAETEADTHTTRVREDSFGSLDHLAIASVKGLYGWPLEDREGTDERVWNGTAPENRARCIQVAVQRLEGEGKAYQGKLFRRILVDVIAEQRAKPAESRGDPASQFPPLSGFYATDADYEPGGLYYTGDASG